MSFWSVIGEASAIGIGRTLNPIHAKRDTEVNTKTIQRNTKSTTVTGDQFSAIGRAFDGALNATPIVGHVKGAIHYANGDMEAGTRAIHSANCATADAIGDTVSKVGDTVSAVGGVVGGALNTIPVVGHVKGAIHYATGDREAGTKAMQSATRTAAVIGGGVVGAVGGPAGAVAGAIGAGAAVDTIVTIHDSILTDEYRPHGQLEAWSNVFTGNDVMANLADAAITTTMDGLGGYGASSLGKAIVKDTGKAAMKSTSKEVTKMILKQEVKNVALKGAASQSVTKAYKELKKEGRRRKRWSPGINGVDYDCDYDGQYDGEFSDFSESQNSSTESNRSKDQYTNRVNWSFNNQSLEITSGGEQPPSDDDYEESDNETDIDDVSSTDDETESDESDDESSCQAVKVNGKQCKKRAITNGACVRWKHQLQMKRFKGRLRPLPRFRPLRIESLNGIKEMNSEKVKKWIDSILKVGPHGEPGYIYLFQIEGLGTESVVKIGCTQRHPNKRMNEQYKDCEKVNARYWRCPSYQLIEHLIHMFLSYARLRDSETNRLVELFDVSLDVAERVCMEIIEAIKENIDNNDDDDEEDEDL